MSTYRQDWARAATSLMARPGEGSRSFPRKVSRRLLPAPPPSTEGDCPPVTPPPELGVLAYDSVSLCLRLQRRLPGRGIVGPTVPAHGEEQGGGGGSCCARLQQMGLVMSASTRSTAVKASWLPLLIVMMCQIQLSFNAFNVSISGITEDLDIPATAVGTALTTGTFAMAGFILLGAKLGAKIGVRLAFQIGVLIPAIAAALIATAQNGTTLLIAQAISGASVALSAPALTVIIARNYKEKQQAQAIGFLAAAIPLAQVISLLVAGYFASTIGWRWSFALVACIGLLNFALSWLLKPIPPQKSLVIDWIGAGLSSAAIILISFALSGLTAWGFLVATDAAPFNVLGLSPVPVLTVAGLVLGQLFLVRTRKRMAGGSSPLLSLKVLGSAAEKATLMCMSAMLFTGTAASFLLPLYMQVVQGFGGIQTSLSLVPYTLSIFVANTIVARFYDRFAPRQIARTGFIVVTVAFIWLAATIHNDWGTAAIISGLIVLGLAQGCIVALVFNTLLTAAPADAAGDVGALRGLTHNISGSAGIAVATAMAVAILGGAAFSSAERSPVITESLIQQLNFDNANFITNDQLKGVLEGTTATPAEVEKAVAVLEDSRLDALRLTMLILAAIAALAIVPAGRMPGFSKEDLPSEAYPDSELQPSAAQE